MTSRHKSMYLFVTVFVSVNFATNRNGSEVNMFTSMLTESRLFYPEQTPILNILKHYSAKMSHKFYKTRDLINAQRRILHKA